MPSLLFLAFFATLFLALSPHSAADGPQPTVFPSKHKQVDKVVLQWEGHTRLPFDEDSAEHCNRLVITADNRAQFGKCGEKSRTGQVSFDKIVRQFAPFENRSSDATITFAGQGKVAGDVWQRAIATWASYTFAELYVGHACASCRNVLEWSFALGPNRKENIRMLVVMHHGYAVKLQVPTEGSDAKLVADGWLTTDEWTQLDNWIQTRSSQSIGDGCFLDGKGTQKMSPPELDALREWARKLYDQLQEK
jgi:hypothetical protein